MSMDLTFLGTGSAYPSPTRGASCIALRHDDGFWMFDCGEGSQVQIMKSYVKPGKISKIFITHLHGDHMFGLPALMCTMSQSNQRQNPVEIYGPIGLRKYIRVSLELSRSMLGFTYIVHELIPLKCQYHEGWDKWRVQHDAGPHPHTNEIQGGTINADDDGIWHLFSDKKFEVKAVWLKHRVPSFGFMIQESSFPGKLDPKKAISKGLKPGPEYAKLKAGESVKLPSGEEIRPEDVVGPPRPGRKILIMGDSCDSTQVYKVGQDADVLVHEATLENGMLDEAIEKGHSTPSMAAELARELNVGKLVLTHFSQRYQPDPPSDQENEKMSSNKKLRLEQTNDAASVKNISETGDESEAKKVTNEEDTVSKLKLEAEADVDSKQTVIAAQDFLTITIPMKGYPKI